MYLLLKDGSWVALIAFDKVDKVVHVCTSAETVSLVDRRAALDEVVDICECVLVEFACYPAEDAPML